MSSSHLLNLGPRGSRFPHGSWSRLVGGALALMLASSAVSAGAVHLQGRSDQIPVPVVRLPFSQDDGSLTPYTFELAYPLVTLVYDTLMWRDKDGLSQPWLARSVDSGPDPRRVTVTLAPDIRWHDGRRLTSADVAFTFEYFQERPHPRFTPELRAVERVDAVDPITVVVTLRYPSPGFVDQPLADLPILPAHLWQEIPRDRLAPDGLPVGSGPYRLVEHRPGVLYRFEANEHYFRGRPAVEAIEVPIMKGAAQMVRALEGGGVDMIPANLPAASAKRLQAVGTRVMSGPSYLGTVLMFNVRRPPFDNPEVRRAVARAIDIKRIASAVGNVEPAVRGYVHPQSQWAPADTSMVPGTADGADPILIGLPSIEVLVAQNDPTKVETARQIVLALNSGGAQATSKPLPREELSTAVGQDGSTATFHAAIWTTPILASHDPDFLATVFGSDTKTATLNYSGYRSQDFDELASRVATTAPPLTRKGIVAEELRLIAHDAPVVPLFFPTGSYAYRPAAYDGWVFMKGTGILDKRSFVEPRVPEEPALEASRPVDTGGSSGLSLTLVGISVVALALVLAVAELIRSRR